MFRWACCGLLILLAASVTPAQTADLFKELFSLQPGGQGRPNPFGGEPITILPQAAQAGPAQPILPPLPPELGPGYPTPRSNARPGRLVYTQPGPPKPDINGDPLPAGAIARFGSGQLRHGTKIRAMAFTHDSKHLCTVSGSDDSVKLWETATGKEVARLHTTANLVELAKDGFLVLVNANRIRVWHPDSNLVRELSEKTLPENDSPTALAVNPDGRSIAVGVYGRIILIDIQTGKTLKELALPGGPHVNAGPRAAPAGPLPNFVNGALTPAKLLYSPDGRWLLGSGRGSGVWLWDLRTGKRVRTYRTDSDTVDFSFSTDVTKIVISGEQIRLYALDSEEEVDGFTPLRMPSASHPCYSDDGKLIYFMHDDKRVRAVDAKTGKEKEPLKSPSGIIFRSPFALARDASLAADIDETDGIRIWNPKTGKGLEVNRLPPLFNPSVSADGKTVTVSDGANRIRQFDLATGKPGKVLGITDDTDPICTGWDLANRRVATIVTDNGTYELHFVDINTGKLIAKHPMNSDEGVPIPFTSFASGNRDRAAISTTQSVTVVNPNTGKVVQKLKPNGAIGENYRGAISPDGRLVVVSTDPITVWEVATGKKRFTLEESGCADVAFSDDGRFLIATNLNGHALLVDLRTGTTSQRINEDDDGISSAAMSRDNKRIAVGLPSGRVTILDAGGEPVVTFAGHDGEVTGLRFTADGKKLVSTSRDGTALVWDVPEKPYRPAPGETRVSNFDDAFRLLANADPAQAQRGLNYLYNNPADAVRQAAARMPSAPATPATKLKQLVGDLGNDDYQTREAALKELEKLGGEAASLLKEVERSSSNAEARKLATELLAKFESPTVRADDLKILRSVEAVEHIGTPEARAQLEKWASGPAGHRLTVEAAAAIERLKAHSGK